MAKHQHGRAATLSVTLPIEMAQAVYAKVKQGVYGSAGELIREAVGRLLAAEGDAPPSDGEADPGAPPDGARRGRRG